MTELKDTHKGEVYYRYNREAQRLERVDIVRTTFRTRIVRVNGGPTHSEYLRKDNLPLYASAEEALAAALPKGRRMFEEK